MHNKVGKEKNSEKLHIVWIYLFCIEIFNTHNFMCFIPKYPHKKYLTTEAVGLRNILLPLLFLVTKHTFV